MSDYKRFKYKLVYNHYTFIEEVFKLGYDKFYCKIWKHGLSKVVTIPFNLLEGNGWKEGTEVVVMVKKKVD